MDDLLEEVIAEAESSGVDEAERHLEQLCQRYPAHAAQLRRRTSLLRELGVLSPVVPSAADDRAPTHLGPYRLLRSLGAGGMGVVHLAEDENLGREVAVKVLRAERLFFEGARERFQREVETVARLRHPSIVPVYAVGDAEGVPYFVMEYVKGCSLGEALVAVRREHTGRVPLAGRDLARAVATTTQADSRESDESDEGSAWLYAGSWEDTMLRIAGLVASALDHAHRCGVVHRDVKPSNIMLTHGESGGQVKLLDFGLARPGDDVEALTRSGAQIGSLPYMAPEQVSGEVAAVDARTDVYGLGVTLYEALTLQRPYRANSDAELARQIEEGRALPARRHAPGLSWEAETVCATAMEVDADRRYATAADFARDLEAAAQRRPLEARRVGWTIRARRWVQRKPAAATAIVLATLLAVGVPWLVIVQERRRADDVQLQLERADAHFARSLEAIDRMLTRIGSEALRHVPQMEPLRRAFLADAVELVEETLEQESDDPATRRQLASSLERLGSLEVQLGDLEHGLESLRRSRGLHDEFVGSDDSLVTRAERGSLLVALGQALFVAGNVDESEQTFRAADDDLARALERADPTSDQFQRIVTRRAAGAKHLGELLSARLPSDTPASESPAMPEWRRAESWLEAAVAKRPDDAATLLALGDVRYAMAQLALRVIRTGQRPDELRLLDAADEAFERAAELAPDDARITLTQASARLVRARTLQAEGHFAESEAVVLDVLPVLRDLTDRYPSTPEYGVEYATALNIIGVSYDWRRRFEDMETWCLRSAEVMRDLATRFPLVVEIQSRAGEAEKYLGIAYLELRRLAEAEAAFERGVDAQARAYELAPDKVAYGLRLRVTYQALSDTLASQRRWQDAAAAADRMATILTDDPESYSRAGSQLANIIGALQSDHASDPDGSLEAELVGRAVAHLRESLERGLPFAHEFPTAPPLRPLHGHPAFDELIAELAAP